jgi:hypothetical protein
VLIWGDDQYENFKEDIVPAFSVLAYEDMTITPWEQASESSGFNASIVDDGGRCCKPSSTPPMPGVKEASEVAELLLRLESMLATYR